MNDSGPSTPNPQSSERFTYRSLLRNYISLSGLVIGTLALANIIVLSLIDMTSSRTSPYIGLLAYMILPVFFVLGVVLVVVGVVRERHRRLTAVAGEPLRLSVDLTDPGHQARLIAFAAGVAVFTLLSAFGSYHAYEFTDSTAFCGHLCHTVMHPESVAHDNSPHARVPCVACHVGPGASWYVKSKLAGAHQVIATVLDDYPRPIETPIANLRPASQTCEQCHWPRFFWGAQLKVFNMFAYDEQNTPMQIRLLIKTGGGSPNSGMGVAGIHWHMNIANTVEYRSGPKRQHIPWVKITDSHGDSTIYRAPGATDANTAKLEQRQMDCVDCHNRPTHKYNPPDLSVNESLAANRISPTLPYAKKEAVAVLTASYKTTPQAMHAIAQEIPAFYQKNYPQLALSRAGDIHRMVKEVQRIFRTNIFPEMKVNWNTHPDNIGHYYYIGCFRCHDGKHKSADGKVITKNCTACHTVLNQEVGTLPVAVTTAQAVFKHPIPLGDLTKVTCTDCHGAGSGL